MDDAEEVRRLARVRVLCEGALELDARERAGWLSRMCADEPELAREVRDLLERIEHGGVLAQLLRELR